MMGYCIRAAALFLCLLGCAFAVIANERNEVDSLLDEFRTFIRSTPEKASVPLAKLQALQALQATFTSTQNENYHAYYAKYLGFQGRHEQRISLVQSMIDQVKTPSTRASLLYDLVDGNRALGNYDSALRAMNESILLLPSLERTFSKLVVLQGAVSLLYSMRSFEEALVFAERISALEPGAVSSSAHCYGLADKVDLNFKLGKRQRAQSLVQEAVLACDASKDTFNSLLVKSYAAIDLVDSGQYSTGIATGLPLVTQFQTIGTGSNWLAALEDALARAYLKTGNTERAEHFGTRAYQRAQSSKDLEWQEKTSETMALIKRAQGQFAEAIAYYDTNLAFKKQVLNDQQQKNLAYQRVKFDTQDKANQMALLEQKNKTLSTEKALQQNKYQNLILLLTLGSVVLAILGAWLFNTLRLKNTFRVSAQVDGLTQVSNRAHFTACAQGAFKDSTRSVSLVLFDMDLFKKINDTFGHTTGDWVLKTVCSTVKNQLQDAGFLGRLGGEEFAFCLPHFTRDKAEMLAERCRSAVAAIDTHPSGFVFQISASFGIATRGANIATSFDETLVQADKALYLSKNEGRNRVTVYLHSGTY
jgi:diguanylate cyclase (GGDEF)-like protein